MIAPDHRKSEAFIWSNSLFAGDVFCQNGADLFGLLLLKWSDILWWVYSESTEVGWGLGAEETGAMLAPPARLWGLEALGAVLDTPELVDNGVEAAEIDNGPEVDSGPRGVTKGGNNEKVGPPPTSPAAAELTAAAADDRIELGKAASAADTAGARGTPPRLANELIPAIVDESPPEGDALTGATLFFRCQDTMCIFMLPAPVERRTLRD